MRLGVISDTHGFLRREVFSVFAEVDHILHAGDIGGLDLLAELETIAPVTAVHGNTDDWDVRARCPAVQEIEVEGFRLVLTHGHLIEGGVSPETLHARWPDAEILIHGHTHEAVLTMVDVVVTVLNPGPAGRQRIRTLPSVGILELEPGIPPRGRIVPLTEE